MDTLLAVVQERFIYEPLSGIIYNRNIVKRGKDNKIAGGINRTGYIVINISGKLYLAHRIAWLLTYGTLPTYIDHIDGNKLNNALSNLRETSVEGNTSNAKCRKDNRLGIKGVTFYPKGYYKGIVQCKGIRHSKFFKCKDYTSNDEAMQAATTWVRELREQLHGEFANHG